MIIALFSLVVLIAYIQNYIDSMRGHNVRSHILHVWSKNILDDKLYCLECGKRNRLVEYRGYRNNS